MIHYHGLPITPAVACTAAVGGGHAFVSFVHPDQCELALEVCQTVAFDNGAFSAWMSGKPITDWHGFYTWVNDLRKHPAFAFAVVPDVIAGNEEANDALADEWPFRRDEAAVVWHLDESIERLVRLAHEWPRVAFGSSGKFDQIGTREWWERISQGMDAICDNGGKPICKIHGLRMLDPKIFTRFPFSSADSTNIARNIGIDSRWNGSYTPPNKQARAAIIRQRIESYQSPSRWKRPSIARQISLFDYEVA